MRPNPLIPTCAIKNPPYDLARKVRELDAAFGMTEEGACATLQNEEDRGYPEEMGRSRIPPKSPQRRTGRCLDPQSRERDARGKSAWSARSSPGKSARIPIPL